MQEALEICQKIKQNGGRALFVGGYVRDSLLGLTPKDIDIEVFGLPPDQLKPLLGDNVKFCGESFGVYKVGNFDISIPRREVKTGPNHVDFSIEYDPHMSVQEAASRRDFTINAILYDPLEEAFLDPFNGLQDLSDKRLQITSERFAEDPLRVLRAMQFISRFDLQPTKKTINESVKLVDCMKDISKERIYGEFFKWATQSVNPSAGLRFLRDCGWIKNFPVLDSMLDIPTNCGNLWSNTLDVVDRSCKLGGDHIDLFSALFHEVGKIYTARIGDNRYIDHGCYHINSYLMVQKFFQQYFAGFKNEDLDEISTLVKIHRCRPSHIGRFIHYTLKGTSLDRFERLCNASTKGYDSKLTDLIFHCRKYLAANQPEPLVSGQDLLDRGFHQGPQLGRLLKILYEEQVEYGYSKEELLRGMYDSNDN